MTITPEAQRIIDEANGQVDGPSEPPKVAPPPDTVFTLHAGFLSDDGTWERQFEVRELTGRDEEALARVTDPGRLMIAILERGLVRVGSTPASSEVIDRLVAGDWETVLVAIRAVTFGDDTTREYSCGACGQPYEVTINLFEDLPIRGSKEEDLEFEVRGRHGTVYRLAQALGVTQRKILEQISQDGKTTADLNTLLLFDSITSIDDRPVMGIDHIRDISMADRRLLLQEITARRVGPDLQGVTTKCPTCGAEQASPLSVAALFQR